MLRQNDDGTFADVTGDAHLPAAITGAAANGVWAADVDLDGDLDVVVAPTSGAPVVLRNNSDGTFAAQTPFTGVTSLRGFAWADFDGDGVPDAALLDQAGAVHVLLNMRGGVFHEQIPPDGPRARHRADSCRCERRIHTRPGRPDCRGSAPPRLDPEPLDRNGIRRRSPARSTARRRDGRDHPPDTRRSRQQRGDRSDRGGAGEHAGVARRTGGYAHPAARDAGRSVWTASPISMGTAAWTSSDSTPRVSPLVPRAAAARRTTGRCCARARASTPATSGSTRSASAARSRSAPACWCRSRPSSAPVVHFGLGTSHDADVIRIVWPNGILQSEFDKPADHDRRQQRLKGSCPWVFAWDGREMPFVTDLLWRSPLGLRINAQDTADVLRPRTGSRFRGDQLVPRDGAYDLRITAELWETHFFDHVSLLVVDHPAARRCSWTSASPVPPPSLDAIVTGPVRPFAPCTTIAARDVTRRSSARADDTISIRPGAGRTRALRAITSSRSTCPTRPRAERSAVARRARLDPSDRQQHQRRDRPGPHEPPHGLSLEVADRSGPMARRAAEPRIPGGQEQDDPGRSVGRAFVAGAHDGVSGCARTWRSTGIGLGWADRTARTTIAADARWRSRRRTCATRGFSSTSQRQHRARRNVRDTSCRWHRAALARSEGYYTRFGDVRELLTPRRRSLRDHERRRRAALQLPGRRAAAGAPGLAATSC